METIDLSTDVKAQLFDIFCEETPSPCVLSYVHSINGPSIENIPIFEWKIRSVGESNLKTAIYNTYKDNLQEDEHGSN